MAEGGLESVPFYFIDLSCSYSSFVLFLLYRIRLLYRESKKTKKPCSNDEAFVDRKADIIPELEKVD